MIYLKNNGEKQECFIPKNLGYEGKKTYKEGVEYQKSLIEPITITENGVYENENGFNPVVVSVVGGDVNLINKDVVMEEEHITLNAANDGADGYRSVDIDASVLANRKFEEGFEQGKNECPDCDDLTELIVRENGVYEGAFNRVDVYVEGGGEGSCNLEDKWVTPSMADRDENGFIVTSPTDGFDGLSRVVLDPSTIYNEGVEQGRNEGCSEQTYINPIIVSDGSGKVNGDEGVDVPHFVYGGNTQYEVQGIRPSDYDSLFIKTSIECFGVDYDNLSEPINVIGAENADWNETTFGLRIWDNRFSFKIGRWEKSFPFSYGWHDIEMGYNTEKSWLSIDGEYVFSTDEDEENLPYTDRTNRQIMIGAINSENGAFRPFYGNIGVTYIECDGGKIYLVPSGAGKMLEYYNDFNNPWTTLEGQGSYDVRRVYGAIKTFTWLGNNNTTSFIDLEATENRVYSPSEYGVDYFKSVNVNVPSTVDYVYHIVTAIGGVMDYGNVTFNVRTIRQKAYNITTFWSDRANGVIENGNLSPDVLVHSLIFGTSSVGAYSFQNMKSLTDITIRPQNIGDYAFANCYNLNRITLYGFNSSQANYNVSDTAFEGVAEKGVVILYYNGLNEDWVRDVFMTKLPSGWTYEIIELAPVVPDYYNKIALEIETDDVNEISVNYDMSFVTSNGDKAPVYIMYDLPNNYFWSYSDVTNGIAQLRQNAFNDYNIIKKAKLNTIITLGERAFKNAVNLTEVEFSNLINYIATEAFDGCTSLSKIVCRATTILLGSNPFNGLPENGILYLEDGADENVWLEKLPNGWTVERL